MEALLHCCDARTNALHNFLTDALIFSRLVLDRYGACLSFRHQLHRGGARRPARRHAAEGGARHRRVTADEAREAGAR